MCRYIETWIEFFQLNLCTFCFLKTNKGGKKINNSKMVEIERLKFIFSAINVAEVKIANSDKMNPNFSNCDPFMFY